MWWRECCINIPCAYFPTDFITFDVDTIKKVIEKYNAVIYEVRDTGIYILRARGILDDDNPVVTKYYEFGNKCIYCTENGCSLSEKERPGWGLYSKPVIIRNGADGFERGNCQVPAEIMKNNYWAKQEFQKVLQTVVTDLSE